MRVCVLIDAWEPVWGGGQTHVLGLSRHLAKDFGVKIDIFSRKLKDQTGNLCIQNEKLVRYVNLFRCGITTTFFNLVGRLSWFPAVVIRVIQRHRIQPYDLLHAHAFVSAVPAWLLGKLLGVPVVFTVHGSHQLDQEKQTFGAMIEKFLLTKIPFTWEITVSQRFLKYTNVNKNISVIPNGVDIATFDRVKKRYQPRSFTFLWVGRFHQDKNVPLLVRAFAKLTNKYPRSRLQLVGYGYVQSAIVALIHELGLEKQVELKGKLTGKQLIQVYKRADSFVLPSIAEGQPITILEAWAAKLPVIVTQSANHDALVKNGFNGLVVSQNTELTLVTAMKKMLQMSATKRRDLGLAGYRQVNKKYTWSEVAQKTLWVYKEVLGL